MAIKLSQTQAATLQTLRHGPIIKAVRSPTNEALVSKGYAEFSDGGDLVITEEGRRFLGR